MIYLSIYLTISLILFGYEFFRHREAVIDVLLDRTKHQDGLWRIGTIVLILLAVFLCTIPIETIKLFKKES